ncbi:MAG TPA: flippase-like domain-containing protein, partial [Methanocorpusculum sp.]|nr:flippase-like domain-containing protein [Methanocorpusculum sp.]
LDGIILALGTIVCMVLLGTIFAEIQMPDGALIAAYVAAGVFAGLVILFLIIAKHPAWGLALMRKIARFISRKKDEEKKAQTLEKFEGYANKFYSALHFMASNGKTGIAWGFLFSALYWINEFAIAFFILWGLGVEPTPELFLLSIVMQLLVTVICMIPLTPGAVGIAEASLGLFYSIIVPAGIVGLFVLIYRFIFYYFNLIIGFAASMIIVRRETKNKETG